MSKILVSGGLVPTTKDTLLDARTRVATFSEIANIENPARFMVITVEDTGKKYEVRKLSSKIIGGIVVENSTININDPEALVDLGLAEELRSEDEKVRQSNENKRIEAENLRKSAEDIRKVNETNRVSAEGVREASERTRVSSEEIRNANEQTRNSNETKRQSQESTRQSQESARQSNESTRNVNESARKEAESERKTEETSRRTAEISRSSAENTRVKNEQNRTTAENTRSSAEDRRVSNETQRTANETARNNAELSREQAEGNRASTFNTLKGQMQTTIQEGQTAVAATEKAISDAQKVVDEYDTKVAEQDSKLTELGSEGTDFSRGVYASVGSWLSGISLGGFSSGVKTNNTKRARFNGYITAPFRIETNEGYIVRQITKFEKLNDGTLNYVSQEGHNSNEFFVENKNEYLYTIAFSKLDDTQDLNTTDLPLIVKTFKGWGMYIEENIEKLNKNVENVENELAELNTAIDKYDGNVINNITLERGFLFGGVPEENDKRCRNIGYIESPFNVTLSSAYRVTSIYRYNKSLEYIGSDVIKNNFVQVAEDEYLYRFAISKVDDTQVIEIEEISTIVESYNNKSTLIDKGLVDSTKQIEHLLTQTKDISSLEKREKGIFVSYENGAYNINTESSSWESWVVDADNIKNIEATLGYSTDLQCNVVLFKGNDFTVENIIDHVRGTKVNNAVNKYFKFNEVPSDCTKIVFSNRIASYSNPSITVEKYINIQKEFQLLSEDIQDLKGGIELEIGSNNGGVATDNKMRARTKDFVKSPFVVTTNDNYQVKAVYRYEQNGTYIDYATINKQKYESSDDGCLYKIVFSNVDDSVEITTKELKSIIESFKDKDSIQREKLVFDVEELKKTTNITIPNVYITSQRITKFATYDNLIQAYDALIESHPNIISKKELGTASDGQMLYEYFISNGSYNKEGLRGKDEEIEKPLVLIDAGIHGYEPESNTALYIFVSDLVKGNLSLSKIRNTCDFKVIPCLNPYGYDHNRRGNANNVDLNRNFEVDWIEQGDVSANPSYYGGPSAASEAETKIMQQWLRDNINAVLFIDFHNSSFENEISCVGGSNELEGMTEFKKKYLIGVHKLSSYFTSIFNIPDSSVWGYSYESSLEGSSGKFRNSLGIVGGVLETSQNVNNEGANSPITIAVGADVLGTIILSCVKLE